MSKLQFKIIKINNGMSHDEKVYEYARRISYYSLAASNHRIASKKFDCEWVDRNETDCGERCGCLKRDRILRVMLISEGDYEGYDNLTHEFCHSCQESREHYDAYREAVSKKAAALRQLNREMTKNS